MLRESRKYSDSIHNPKFNSLYMYSSFIDGFPLHKHIHSCNIMFPSSNGLALMVCLKMNQMAKTIPISQTHTAVHRATMLFSQIGEQRSWLHGCKSLIQFTLWCVECQGSHLGEPILDSVFIIICQWEQARAGPMCHIYLPMHTTTFGLHHNLTQKFMSVLAQHNTTFHTVQIFSRKYR